MELRAEVHGIAVFDDFAHHPTAIRTTLQGLRAEKGAGRIMAVLEPRSNTMKSGVHQGALGDATADADQAFWLRTSDMNWDLAAAVGVGNGRAQVFDSVDDIVTAVVDEARAGDRIVVMSNGGFQGIHERLIKALGEAHE